LFFLCSPARSYCASITSKYEGPSPGVWSDPAFWSPSGVPNNGANQFQAIIANGSLVTLDVSPTVDTLFVGVGNRLDIQNGSFLTLSTAPGAGQITNNGLISFSSTGTPTGIVFTGTGTGSLSGTGTTRLGNNSQNFISSVTGASIEITAGHLVEGSGSIFTTGAILNAGTVRGVNPTELLLFGSGSNVNSGSIEAVAGGVPELGGSWDNTGGEIVANGGTLSMAASAVTGGTAGALTGAFNQVVGTTYTGTTLVAGSGGTFNVNAFSTLNGGAINIDSGGVFNIADNQGLSLSGTVNVTNNGLMQLGTGGPALFTGIFTNGPTNLTFNGTGRLLMVDNGGPSTGLDNFISGSLVNGAGHTIEGSGFIGSAWNLTNQGKIAATDTAHPLLLETFGTNVNQGLITANTGATLELSGSWDNTGGTISAHGGTLSLFSNAILGGSLISEAGGDVALLDNPTLTGVDFHVDSSSTAQGGYVQTGGSTINDGTFDFGAGTADIVSGLFAGDGSSFGSLHIGPDATLSPGDSPGEYTHTGLLDLSGIFLAELGGTVQGVTYDHLIVNGLLQLDPTSVLDVAFFGGFDSSDLVLGDVFALIDYTSFSGTFGRLDLPGLPSGWDWQLTYNPNELDLRVERAEGTTVPEPQPLELLGFAIGAILLAQRRRFFPRRS